MSAVLPETYTVDFGLDAGEEVPIPDHHTVVIERPEGLDHLDANILAKWLDGKGFDNIGIAVMFDGAVKVHLLDASQEDDLRATVAKYHKEESPRERVERETKEDIRRMASVALQKPRERRTGQDTIVLGLAVVFGQISDE